MPNKTPKFWEDLLVILSQYGVVMCITFILSYLRITYEQKEYSIIRRLLESSIGALLALSAGLTFEKLGVSEGWKYGVVSFIRVFGVDQIKEWGKKCAENKIKDYSQYKDKEKYQEKDEEL